MPTPFTMTRRVLFHETDLAGVMHFSNYFRIMEEAEHAWWRSLGHSVHTSSVAGILSWPRVSVTCDYAAPVQFEDELELSLVVTDLTDKSLTVKVDFSHAGRRVASGQMRSVCCRLEAGKFNAVSIPPDLRARLLACRE
jgi:YbgC/YbaW family acyl-CoA thioester hydrolase